MGDNGLRVEPLADHRDLIPQVAHLLAATWPEYYGDAGPGFASHDATERASGQDLPIGFVAIDETGNIVGSGTLAGPSYGAVDSETPWIIGVCVAPEQRNKGIASRIVKALCQCAAERGHDAVFATTVSAEGLLARAGFRPLRHLTDDKGVWVVMRKDLN